MHEYVYSVNMDTQLGHGDYSEVKMLTTNDVIRQDGDTVTFSTAANRVYYQGTMKDTEIPWDISIRFFLDGTEYSAQDIAGKNGKLEIRFKVSKNALYQGCFFDDYALQASFTLNTDNCENINASDATEANVGKNKQLSYTIFPGKGIDTVISADVNDFEMDAVSINGIKLHLNIEVDDAELMDKITELTDGVTEAKDGTIELQDGASELKDGSSELKEKYETFDAAISEFANALAGTINNISKMSSGINTLIEKYTELDNGFREYTDGVAQLVVGYSEIVDGITELAQGSKELRSGSDDLYSGANELYNGVVSQYDGANELADGMSEMHEKTSDIDSQAESAIDDVIASIQGSESETVSFVSVKNTNVESVQFVIQTAAIEIAEAPVAPLPPKETLTFWQKLLRLFGLS